MLRVNMIEYEFPRQRNSFFQDCDQRNLVTLKLVPNNISSGPKKEYHAQEDQDVDLGLPVYNTILSLSDQTPATC